ncbi:type VII secretion-associated serine protease mycosin [Streptomyces subrutilus]|uniref:Type VII secretion-associated serine protease n=1 Tax=Streptomyces subrutilus TaxID=36818 RepID=A0A5P2UJ69_9ACTN|nr:type VII secretion-associated serine protease mycosin [Streptomyces subrutilus]QEU78469.1 type VII secretion-associated serine protease mycosin [Streptomyces subrutilus]WSJ32375.1 type VII secretion-associated serine protease mycosin [Streptomyces subrutilus]GGZ78768.1 type VII secretion-associated serine protease [Streptomyces subrutilus]
MHRVPTPRRPAAGRRPLLPALALGLVALTAAPAQAADGPGAPGAPYGLRPDGAGECTFPMKKQIEDRPWALQRLLLDELWARTKGKDAQGRSVRVAVIDTGVDRANPQLGAAVDRGAGLDLVDPKGGDGTADSVGHGTKVAGLIAARPQPGTGFVGLAPDATIIPIRQNDGQGKGDSGTLARAIDHAVAKGAQVINVSQDTDAQLSADSALATAVRKAIEAKVVVVASAGNDGAAGVKRRTYPAAFPGVLAVASSDRNNERAAFSQPGDFVGIAAPGVDMVSTVPGFGQCIDNGTSFSAPYVAGVAALLRAEHPDWSVQQIVWQIQNTAERTVNGRDDYVGWGVVDPVRALGQDHEPPKPPVPDPGPPPAAAPQAAVLRLTETPREREERLGAYALGIAAVLIAVIAGTATVVRDARNRRRRLQ